MKLPLGFVVAMAAVGCAGSHTAAPPGVPVNAVTAEKLTLHGTASPTLSNPSCTASNSTAKPAHVIEFPEDTRATILLTPLAGETALPPTMLHVTSLDTNQTWCVMTQADGSPAALGANFPSGQYGVSVAEVTGASPRKYEVRVQKL